LDDDSTAFAGGADTSSDALPAWRHLSRTQYRDRIRELIHEIEHETRTRHREDGTRPLGPKMIRLASPRDRAMHRKRSHAPRLHAASRETRKALRDAYRIFVAAFVAASQRYRQGDRLVIFPEGCFPPRLPFQPLPTSPVAGLRRSKCRDSSTTFGSFKERPG
jgi:hypothetical protein